MTDSKKALLFGKLPSGSSAMSDAEREAHIDSCSQHFLAAYQRFEDYGLPSDRDEAYQWLHVRDQAVRERLIDQGQDYFAVQGAKDGCAMRAKREVVHG